MTDGGLDFTFECIGNVKTMVSGTKDLTSQKQRAGPSSDKYSRHY